MEMEREIGERGQVVIPKDIRRLLGLHKGQKVIFEARNKEVIIKSAQNPQEFLEDFFSAPKRKQPLTLREIKKEINDHYDLP